MTTELRGSLETTTVGGVSLVLTEGVRPRILRGATFFVGWATALDMTADAATIVYCSLDGDEVITYDWVDPAWVQRGSALTGGFGDEFGTGVQISNDGTTLVVGEPLKDNGGTLVAGALRRYTRNGTVWDFDYEFLGTVASDGIGHYLGMNSDASIVIAGTLTNKFQTYDWSGSAYSLRAGGTKTAPTSIHGTVGTGSFGRNLSASSDGTRVAVTYRVDGYANDVFLVRVFEWGGASWGDLGSEIIGPLGTDEETCVGVFLSGDGLKLYTLWNDSQAAFNGVANVYVYDWVDPNWVLNVSEGDAYGVLEDYSNLTDKVGMWVSADENITAMLMGDTNDIGFFGYPENITGDCIRKTADTTKVKVIGSVCADVEPTNFVETVPSNIPQPPFDVSLPNPDNDSCTLTGVLDAFVGPAGGPSSSNTAYEDYVRDNYWDLYNAGVCVP